jgi:starch-binding outer membrane protein, SusD/RagB family
MKNKIASITILALFLLFGCSDDFLNRPPLDSITIDNFYETPAQIDAATALLYGWPWFTLNDKAHWTIGDSGGGNDWTNDGQMAQFFTFSVTTNNAHLNEAWVSLWMVVAHANAAINEIPNRAGPDVPDRVVRRAVAEGRYMRATAYFYLVRLWGGVPIIENNTKIVFDSKIPRNRIEDVYTLIIRDLEKAAEDLPDTPASPGRLSAWVAKSMLAKVHLAYSGYNQSGSRRQADLDKAAQLAADVIINSRLALLPNYANLFRYESDNNQESLFAFQWISCLAWGTQNTNQAYLARSGAITGAGDGWGGYKGPTIDLQREYEPGDLRRKSTFMLHGDHYPELNRTGGGYTVVVNPASDAGPVHAFVKKYVIGSANDNGGPGTVCFMSTGQNTYIQRLADVYLIYAEAVLGNNTSTSDPGALAAFNAIRTRAGLPPLASFTWEDIRRERRIEFAYEADYWYDLVRWHYWNPQAAIDHVSNQERGTYVWNAENQEVVINSRKYPVTSANFTLPIPQADADSNPLLLEDPVPYDFGGK